MLWLKALHIIAFAAWMAGMWYLPRLMVYHSEAAVGSETSELLKVMERRLLRAIATPALVVTIVAGLMLASWGDWWSAGWLHAKLVLVLGMAACHGAARRAGARPSRGPPTTQRPLVQDPQRDPDRPVHRE